MLIEIHNFRKHRDLIVELIDGSVNLIDGLNGSGKSTIIEALIWCLYGNMQLIYPHRCEKVRTIVKITYRDIVYERTRNPTNFIVILQDQSYRGEDAKNIVIDNFGSKEEFESCCRLGELGSGKFMHGGPTVRINLLNKFSFRDDNPRDYIVPTKKDRDRYNKELTIERRIYEREKSSFLSRCRELDRDPKDINSEYVFHTRELNSEKREISKDVTRLKRLHRTYIENSSKKEVFEESLLEHQTRYDALYEYDINYLREYKDKCQTQIRNESMESNIQSLEENQDSLTSKLIGEYIETTQQEVNTIINIHREYIKNIHLCRDLGVSYDKEEIVSLTEYKEQCLKYLPIYKKIDNLNRLKGKLDLIQIDKEYDDTYLNKLKEERANIERSKNDLECPCCTTKLKYIRGKLIISEDAVFDQDRINFLNNEINNVSEILRRIKDRDSLLQRVSILEGDLVEIPENIEKVNERETRLLLSNLYKITFVDNPGDHGDHQISLDIDRIRSEIESSRSKIVLLNDDYSVDRFNEMAMVYKERENLNTQIDNIKQSLEHLIIENIDENEITLLEDRLKEISSTINSEKIILTLSNMKRTLQGTKNRVDELERKFIVYEEMYREAIVLETTRLVGIVNHLNNYMRRIYERIFNDPITILLKLSSINSKGEEKRNVHVEVLYAGGVTKNLDCISTAEKQRINLVIVMALNTLSNADILVLDEAVVNLDTTTTEKTMEMIREFCVDKTVCVMNHKDSQGNYDNIIKL